MPNNTAIDGVSVAGGPADGITTMDLSTWTGYSATGQLPASAIYVSTDTSTEPTPVTDANGFPVRPATSTTWSVTAASLPLPSGAATSAKQDTIIAHVDGIEAYLSALVAAVQTEDAAHASFALGFMGLAVRRDTPGNLSDLDGDYEPLQVSNGRLWTSTVVTGSVAVTNAGTFVVQVDGTALTRLTDIETNTDSLAVVGNGAAATAQRVTLANDSTGTIATVGAVTAITNALPAGTNAIGKVGHDTTGMGHGVTTVTTAGTDVALAGSTACKWVIVQSQTDNTGLIAVGASGVDATVATGTGVILNPGQSITLPIDNLADVFIDSTVNGEGVRYTYGT